MLPSLISYITCTLCSACFSTMALRRKRKTVMSDFLHDRSGTLSSCLSYKIHSFLKNVTTKRMVPLTSVVAMADSCFIFFSTDPLHLHCPHPNSLGVSATIKGSYPQLLLKKQGLPTACKSNPSIDSASCGHQAPAESWREAENGPIRLVLGRCAVSQADCC